MKHRILAVTGLVVLACGAMAASASGRVTFCSDRSGAWRIWVADADGANMRQLTTQDTDDHDVDPVFSPDGKEILFTSTRGGTSGIWRMTLDGGGPRRICAGDQAEWSPDGAMIVFRRNECILTRKFAGGDEKTLSPEAWPHCSGPSWSPDGKHIAFAARWDAGNAIYIVPSGGGSPVKIYGKKGACEPHWSPDGSRLVYETETHICTINPDGTRNRLLTYFGGVQRYARYSPDGRDIIFCQGMSERGPWELYAIPAAGGTPRRLTEGGSDMHPDWK